MHIDRRRRIIARIGCGAAFVILTYTIGTLAGVFPRLLFPPTTVALKSSRPYDEVRIPFRVVDGMIHVDAIVVGTPVDCIVDTGTGQIMWQNEKFRVSNWGSGGPLPNWDGTLVPGHTALIEYIRIGDFVLENPWTFHFDTTDSHLADPKRGSGSNMILGNAAFRQSVLTIDYPSHLLIIRNLNYDVTNQVVRSQDSLLDLSYPPGEEVGEDPTYILVPGELGSRPVQFTLDTGSGLDGIAFGSTLKRQVAPGVQSVPIAEPVKEFGTTMLAFTEPIKWRLGNSTGTATGFVMREDRELLTDPLLGYAILKDYRITIDYVRKKVLVQRGPIN